MLDNNAGHAYNAYNIVMSSNVADGTAGNNATAPPGKVPIVDYLQLSDPPHLLANRCDSCGASFFDRRNACAQCGKSEFSSVPVDSSGELVAFTIVHRAAPNIPVPYVSAIVKTDDGVSVRANIVNVEPEPENIILGMKVQLTTYEVGQDDNGTKCIAFGFEPQ